MTLESAGVELIFENGWWRQGCGNRVYDPADCEMLMRTALGDLLGRAGPRFGLPLFGLQTSDG
jgi:hypothetical protein